MLTFAALLGLVAAATAAGPVRALLHMSHVRPDVFDGLLEEIAVEPVARPIPFQQTAAAGPARGPAERLAA